MNSKQRRKLERQGVLLEIGDMRHNADFLWQRKGGMYHFCGYKLRRKRIIYKRTDFYIDWGWSEQEEEIECNGFEMVTDMSRRAEEKQVIEFLSMDSVVRNIEEEYLEMWGMVEYLEMVKTS